VYSHRTTWSDSPSTERGARVSSASWNSGNTNTGSAMKMRKTPVRSMAMTSTFMIVDDHGASEP
jgi:hypothetical protein